jgi:hypothetical protein
LKNGGNENTPRVVFGGIYLGKCSFSMSVGVLIYIRMLI